MSALPNFLPPGCKGPDERKHFLSRLITTKLSKSEALRAFNHWLVGLLGLFPGSAWEHTAPQALPAFLLFAVSANP